jgi:hypothetical protein
MKRKISCDMGENTEAQRHRGTQARIRLFTARLCASVSLCLCVFLDVRRPEARSEQTAIPHQSTEPHS